MKPFRFIDSNRSNRLFELLSTPGLFSTAAKALLRRLGKGFVLFGHGVDSPIDGLQAVNVHAQLPLEEFLRVISLLKALEYRFASLQEVERYAQDISKAPRHWVHLSFDDGYRNNLIVARYLEESGIPWSLFITTDLVEQKRRFGVYKVRCAVLHTTKDIEYPAFGQAINADAPPNERLAFAERAVKLLKSSDAAAAEGIEAFCESLLGAEEWTACDAMYSAHEVLGLDELRTLAAGGNVAVGAHGLTHSCLNEAATPERIRREIADSKSWLEEKLAATVTAFSYPDGQFTEGAQKACEASGYKIAFTTKNDFFCHAPNKLEVGRFPLPMSGVLKAICLSIVPRPLCRIMRSVYAGIPAMPCMDAKVDGKRVRR
ncbi:MAG: polysaccharide deacetylase family protein [Desulfobacteraceae bacterium]|nr:polysaccharide deacetylase family protein [Desulfobacteraceae bacterium]